MNEIDFMASKSWHTKQWKEKKKEVLKDSCEWCRSTEKLLLHHTVKNRDMRFSLMSNKIEDAYVKETGIKPYKVRKGDLKIWVKENPKKIEEMRVLTKEEVSKEYMTMNNTVTLCKKCHFLYEKKHMKLCQVCRQKYHTLRWDSCWNCHKKEQEESEKVMEGYKKFEAEMDAEEEDFFEMAELANKNPELYKEKSKQKLWKCEACGQPIDWGHACNYHRCDACLVELEEEEKKASD
ncbi:MAG: hypothetical protein NT120_02195 [Candidatus Aenigmarchaeota archaeon]|nr:hypothetical protein [Candidatus Aenigmarchaeota archaeon]